MKVKGSKNIYLREQIDNNNNNNNSSKEKGSTSEMPKKGKLTGMSSSLYGFSVDWQIDRTKLFGLDLYEDDEKNKKKRKGKTNLRYKILSLKYLETAINGKTFLAERKFRIANLIGEREVKKELITKT